MFIYQIVDEYTGETAECKDSQVLVSFVIEQQKADGEAFGYCSEFAVYTADDNDQENKTEIYRRDRIIGHENLKLAIIEERKFMKWYRENHDGDPYYWITHPELLDVIHPVSGQNETEDEIEERYEESLEQQIDSMA